MSHVEGLLVVKILRGRNLRDVQMVGKQDPYCVVTAGKHKEIKTPVHDNGGTNLEFNDVVKVELEETDRGGSFLLVVRDENVMVDKDIGGLNLSLEQAVAFNHAEPQWFPIVTKTGQPAGELLLSFSHVRPFYIEVLRAAHLPRVQLAGKQDPYVRLVVGDDDKRRTKQHEDGDIAPQWTREMNNVFRLNLGYFSPHQIIYFRVMNENAISDDIIAYTGANVGYLAKAGREQNPELALPLLTKKNRAAGMLYVRVFQ